MEEEKGTAVVGLPLAAAAVATLSKRSLEVAAAAVAGKVVQIPLPPLPPPL